MGAHVTGQGCGWGQTIPRWVVGPTVQDYTVEYVCDGRGEPPKASPPSPPLFNPGIWTTSIYPAMGYGYVQSYGVTSGLNPYPTQTITSPLSAPPTTQAQAAAQAQLQQYQQAMQKAQA